MLRKIVIGAFSCACITMILTHCSSVGASSLRFTGQDDVTDRVSREWGEMHYQSDYLLINNVWNKGASTGEHYQDIIKGDGFFGWNWAWNGGSYVVAYPQVEHGVSPWNPQKRTGSGFPFKAGSKRLDVSFDVEIRGTGVYDMAFDLWAVSSPVVSQDSITHEIMIWTIDESPKQWGWAVHHGEFSYDGVVFDVYTHANHGDDSGASANHWTYIAFVPRVHVLKATLRIHEFINYLLTEKILPEANYIADVGFGNEVWTGTGYAKIKNYSITVSP